MTIPKPVEEQNVNPFPSNVKRMRVDSVRDFPIGCGIFDASVRSRKCEDQSTVVDGSKDAKSKGLPLVVKGKQLQQFVNHESSVGCADDDVVNRNKVNEALDAYEEILTELLKECNAESNKQSRCKLYMEAAVRVREQGKSVNMRKQLGPVSGIKVGDEFRFRAQLVIVGLHHHYQSGIDYMTMNGKILATSIVDSGRYANHAESSDILIYSGQGGNPTIKSEKPRDQKLKRGNLALKNSMEEGTPVRLIRKHMESSFTTYVYDGLYVVVGLRQQREKFGKLVFKFLLERLSNQPKLRWGELLDNLRRPMVSTIIVCRNDISEGKEKMPIRAVNENDEESSPSFNYLCNIIYPPSFNVTAQGGCDCSNGCLESKLCSCASKNGGLFPYDEKGRRTNRNPLIYECGPLCRCSSSCRNRVTQHGIRFKLEVFKTKSNGWGVRSSSYISEGSFVCEYIGEILQDDDGFALSSAQHGNVGRFVNDSCSPNLYAQCVLYDHDDMRMPHVMFFAKKNIAPKQELTYDYNSSVALVSC